MVRRFTPLVLVLAAVLALAGGTACQRRTTVEPKKAEAVERWTPQFTDTFDRKETVRESTSTANSASASWWLGSGAGFTIADGLGSTLAGDSKPGYFRSRYGLRNPVDTNGGLRPQNVFRVVTKGSWTGDVRQQCYFRIGAYDLSKSPQRYAPNGLLLFNRYADEDNLYYAGIRVDGHAIIKKKSAGVYYTLAEEPVFKGEYDRDTNPMLLPEDTWIGLRSVARDNADGSVTVSLYMDDGRTGTWKLLVKGIDAGVGGQPFSREGHSGIRTDFMDVQFDDYSVATTG